jgi:MFS family permease
LNRPRYALALLTLVYTFSFVDQSLMMLLAQPIAVDLSLSDTQVGFVTGTAFGLLYALLTLPIARWADMGNRVTLAAAAIATWGLTVMSCLAVRTFPQLILARVAAAAGGAGCMPPTYALVGDYFPKAEERTRAIATYLLASSLAVLVSCLVGGWLNDRVGWRMTFFIAGAPGLLVALLVKTTLRDPRQPTLTVRQPHLPLVLKTLWRRPTSRHLTLGIFLIWSMLGGLGPWYAFFLIREHHMVTAELGVWMGLIFGLGGIAGTLLGGYVATRAFAKDEGAQLKLTALATACVAPCHAVFLLVPSRLESLLALIPLIITLNFFLGPSFALLQRLVPDDLRATSMAVVTLFANIAGMGVAPQLVGILSDQFHSLRDAMLVVSLLSLGSAYYLWKAGRTVAHDLLVSP